MVHQIKDVLHLIEKKERMREFQTWNNQNDNLSKLEDFDDGEKVASPELTKTEMFHSSQAK